MDWTAYWFMLPACIVIAGAATFSGISGAALLTPLFLIGFPLFGVLRLTTVQAIGSSLFLETFGFGMGVCRYLRLRLADLQAAGRLVDAATTYLIQRAGSGGLSVIPWNLIVWAVPGALVGALIGTRLQGKVSERKTRLFFSALFFAIGVAFALAFTVFRNRLG